MAGRQAAFVGSATAHGGNVVAGCEKVLINGRHAARKGDPVDCKVHGPGKIDDGKASVLVGNVALARLLEPISCVPAAPNVEPLVDHGSPRLVVGSFEVYADAGDEAVELPEKEIREFLEALDRGDLTGIREAWDKIPLSAKSFVTKMKVVNRSNPRYPNEWREYELSGPGGSAATWVPGQIGDVRPREGGGASVHIGGSVQLAGVKTTDRKRSRDETGAIVEDWSQISKSIGLALEGRLDLDWDWDRIGGSIDLDVGGAGAGRDTIVPAGARSPSPAANQIVSNTSANVLVGA